MCAWLVAHYDVLKDFSAPVVTGLVGAVALFIQISFNRKQAVIAEDKLKFDLLTRRYEVYKALRDFLEALARWPKLAFESDDIKSFYVKMDEARFFFGEDVKGFLKEVTDGVERLVDKSVRRKYASDDSDEWRKLGDEMAADQAVLREKYGEATKRFEHALKFKQLT
jgi:hypothetical protein